MLRRLRRIAHHLNPVVSIGDAGLTDAVAAETERALRDHELIKVKIHSESREQRKTFCTELAERCDVSDATLRSIDRESHALSPHAHHPDVRGS